MHNIIDRPYSIHSSNGMYYSKRKLFDEPVQYDFSMENSNCNYGFIQSSSFHGFDQANQILNAAAHSFNFVNQQKQPNSYSKVKYNEIQQKNNRQQHGKPETRILASPDSGRNSKQRFSPESFVQKFQSFPAQPNHTQRLIFIEDTQPRIKLKRQNDYQNEVNQLASKKSIDQQQQQNSSKLNRKFPTFNNASMLNSLADYNLNSLDDRMFNLNIEYSKSDLKNISLDSLTNFRARPSKNSAPNRDGNYPSLAPKDEFAAYRLNEVDNTKAELAKPTQIPISISDHSLVFTTKNKLCTLSNYNCAKLLVATEPKSDALTPPPPTASPTINSVQTPKKNRHHHHRARRNNRNKNKNAPHHSANSNGSESLKKSQSSLENEHENQDSLSAFDFSNTDEFWEDDIVINSELIEPDKFLADEAIESAPIKFVSLSCDGINSLLSNFSDSSDSSMFDLKKSIIKDKLYEDILDFKDNLTIN